MPYFHLVFTLPHDLTVSVRVRDWTQGNRRRTLSVPAQTFIERFLLHVLPKGF